MPQVAAARGATGSPRMKRQEASDTQLLAHYLALGAQRRTRIEPEFVGTADAAVGPRPRLQEPRPYDNPTPTKPPCRTVRSEADRAERGSSLPIPHRKTVHVPEETAARHVRRAAFARTSDAAISRRLTALRPSRERRSQTKQPSIVAYGSNLRFSQPRTFRATSIARI
jgi:hypothetical protein